MSKIDIRFAELHNSLFLGGRNFQLKIDPKKFPGLKLQYDRTEKELLVHWSAENGNFTGIIPSSNIACMEEGLVETRMPSPHPIVAGLKSAQVDTPMSHVHA